MEWTFHLHINLDATVFIDMIGYNLTLVKSIPIPILVFGLYYEREICIINKENKGRVTK